MARSFRAAQTRGRFGHPEPAQEEVRSDSDSGDWAWLYGDAIGMTPEQLLEHARDRLREYGGEVEKLLRHVPRRFEDRVKALAEPKREAEAAIRAA